MERTNVTTRNAEYIANELTEAMRTASKQALQGMRKRIETAIEKRKENDAKGCESKDFANLEAWKESDSLARLFVAAQIDPHGYINQRWMSDAEMIKRGFDPVSRTHNLKAYKKTRELAEYLVSGSSKLEAVAKTFVACLIQASRFQDNLNRDTLYRFLSRLDVTHVSPELAEAVAEFQAKHMTGGAKTQTSQMCLTLASLGCVSEERDGHSKRLTLNTASPIIATLAERFGMVAELEQARTRQAQAVEPEVTEADVLTALEADTAA
jgi:hypothetical protein